MYLEGSRATRWALEGGRDGFASLYNAFTLKKSETLKRDCEEMGMTEQYYKLYFDDQGSLLNPAEQEAIIASVLDTAEPVTDLWIFSHGWNTDRKAADATYDTWVGRMGERIREEMTDLAYCPAFVGIYWPSMA